MSNSYRLILYAYALAALCLFLAGALFIDRTFRQAYLDEETRQCLWDAVERPRVCVSERASIVPFVKPSAQVKYDLR
jgi:hypothetical protein